MSQGKESNGRMAMIAVLAIAILAISLQILMSMETSLEEGRGPQGGNPFAILSLMFLIVALILLMLTQIRSETSKFTMDNMRIAALMAAIFIIGMLIEPAIPRPGDSPRGFFGAIFILVPVLLIAAMLVPMIPSRSDEEE
ncbi:MAG: hypothetical protein QF911_01040 [Candidatus Thalassarchaeaceae archaeon]|jgi:hypothetical protein|nr:hypothetical protein [Candidatus Thalassarchaeaceae archaeon]